MFVSFLAVIIALAAITFAFRPKQALQSPSPLNQPQKRTSSFQYDKVSVPALDSFDVAETKPYPYRPWKSGKFVLSMGIKKMAQEEWLGLDNKYWSEQHLRRNLLENFHDSVTQALPGSEPACVEVLDMIVSYLTRRFPHIFLHPQGKADYIYNSLTRRTFRVTTPFDIPPLEVAAQLAMEDLNVMIKGFGPDESQHYLAASYSMAPAGWRLQERIGWPLWKIHGPVPLWEDKLRRSVEKAFLRMNSRDLICRHNYFMQTTDALFQQEPFFDKVPATPPHIEDIRIRHERQTLRRLPKTGAILFTVRTYLLPVVELSDEPESIRELLGAVREMHPEMARYKGKQIWGSVVEQWCEQKLRESGLSIETVVNHGGT